jgi:WXG100 family type VII secretion target
MAVMSQAAQQFVQIDHDMQAMLRRLMDELEALHAAWQGRGARSFAQTKTAWAEHLKVMHVALLETAEAIRTAGTHYDASETDAVSLMTQVRGRLDLPL